MPDFTIREEQMKIQHFTCPTSQLLARYIRITITPPYRQIPSIPSEGDLRPHLTLLNPIVIHTNEPEQRLKKSGLCIYCGAVEYKPGTGLALSEEHIVAKGLDGSLILEEASCEECAKQTGEHIENLILRGGMLAPRRHLKIRGRRRKRTEKDYELITVIEGKDVKLRLTLAEHPSILFIIGFKPPRAIGGEGGPGIFFVHTFNTHEVALRHGAESIASHGFDTVRFSQMLAKIAHGYAIARIGAGNFKPYLLDFILRKFNQTDQYPACYDLIGGSPISFAPAETNELHQLGHEIMVHNNKQVILVGIRIFANLGAPLFWVIAGEMISTHS